MHFVGSFPDPAHPLEPPLPEIAFVGRSNVGKSSLLNALVQRREAARVSGTPGKTQLMNVFRLPACYLVDLPGYGYAKASKTARVGFRKLLDTYLRRRSTLAGIVWLLDVRHPPSLEDRRMQALLAETGRPVLAVATKVDKLAPSTRRPTLHRRAADLGFEPEALLPVSSQTGEGIPDLADSILAAVAGARR